MKASQKVSTSEFNKISESKVINFEQIEKDQNRIKESSAKRASDPNIGDEVSITANGVLIAFLGEKLTETGIVLPDTNIESFDAEAPQLVLAVGPMVKEIKRGDNVVLRLNARPDNINYKGKKYLYFREHDVLFIVNKK